MSKIPTTMSLLAGKMPMPVARPRQRRVMAGPVPDQGVKPNVLGKSLLAAVPMSTRGRKPRLGGL